jgi:hypothetical protein
LNQATISLTPHPLAGILSWEKAMAGRNKAHTLKRPASKAAHAAAASVELELSSFIDKFEPAVAELIRDCRKKLRGLLPTAVELVYDNYNFFVIGYSSTQRPSDCIVSIAAAANDVCLSFYRGADVPDPDALLLGEGKQNRFIRIPSTDALVGPKVINLIHSAAAIGRSALAPSGAGQTVIRSVSAKQRPRRRVN